MCNDYKLEIDIASILDDFDDLKIKIKMPEGKPNVAARADIRITDTAPIVSGVDGQRGTGALLNRQWSWPGQGGKPVYNFRSEGRAFGSHRCLILADGFYEFTKPETPAQKRKTKWLFTLNDHRWFGIAGIWRNGPEGEAFTMLTGEAGPDVSPYHHRQVFPLPRDRWVDWLDASVEAQEVLQTLPKGSLSVERVFPPQSKELLI